MLIQNERSSLLASAGDPFASAPATMAVSRIEALVRESERWIVRKIAEWSARQVPKVEWRDGAPLHFLGEVLALRVASGARSHAQLVAGELRVATRGGAPAGTRRRSRPARGGAGRARRAHATA